jgi:hypothetical protein
MKPLVSFATKEAQKKYKHVTVSESKGKVTIKFTRERQECGSVFVFPQTYDICKKINLR